MKYIIPIGPKEKETTQKYINKCSLWLLSFKSLLRYNIKRNKLIIRKNALFSQPNIKWLISNSDYDIELIVNTYINNLQCFYDNKLSRCYYTVPNYIRCPYTATSINVVIRTLEYGGGDLLPLYWIRPTFAQFIETTVYKLNN